MKTLTVLGMIFCLLFNMGCNKVSTPEVVALLDSIELATVNTLQVAGLLTADEKAQIQKDVALAQAAYGDVTANPSATTLQKFQATMQVLSDLIGPILKQAGIVNPLLANVIELIISELNAVVQIVVAAQQSASTAVIKARTLSALRNKDFRLEYSKRITAAGFPQYSLK